MRGRSCTTSEVFRHFRNWATRRRWVHGVRVRTPYRDALEAAHARIQELRLENERLRLRLVGARGTVGEMGRVSALWKSLAEVMPGAVVVIRG